MMDIFRYDADKGCEKENGMATNQVIEHVRKPIPIVTSAVGLGRHGHVS